MGKSGLGEFELRGFQLHRLHLGGVRCGELSVLLITKMGPIPGGIVARELSSFDRFQTAPLPLLLCSTTICSHEDTCLTPRFGTTNAAAGPSG